MPGMTLGDVALWHQFYLAAKPSHVGVDVNGLAYHLHRPIPCCCQMKGQSLLSGTVLSHRIAVGGGISSRGGVEPLGLVI
jgi:hypothetical protein